jgi:hypothetical protein
LFNLDNSTLFAGKKVVDLFGPLLRGLKAQKHRATKEELKVSSSPQ